MSTELLETCRGFRSTYYRRNCVSSWLPIRIRKTFTSLVTNKLGTPSL